MTLTDDIVALLDRDLAEPHRILGAHPVDGGVVIRAFRPDADGVRTEGGGSHTAVHRVRAEDAVGSARSRSGCNDVVGQRHNGSSSRRAIPATGIATQSGRL